jgi:N-acetylmuramoyl-L-alanine amidase
VVLDLRQTVRSRSFTAGPNDQYGDRLVIDLHQQGNLRAVKRASDEYTAGRDVVIAVDPGHGGHDPGAVGRAKTREKDVALAVSKLLASRIDAEPGMRAVLIRKSDYYVDHRERMEIARKNKADLFVSIHADAVDDPRARGASVYVLSLKGASDEAAKRLAQRENASDLVGGVSLKDKEKCVPECGSRYWHRGHCTAREARQSTQAFGATSGFPGVEVPGCSVDPDRDRLYFESQ